MPVTLNDETRFSETSLITLLVCLRSAVCTGIAWAAQRIGPTVVLASME